MKIAILLSTYNGEKYLNKQLESVIAQNINADITLYVRDDDSNDNTLNILSEYSGVFNIKIFKGKNLGPAKSFWEMFMNNDIQADYYAFCDQDDIWDDDKLKKGVAALKKYEDEIALWCSNCRLIDADGNVLDDAMYKQTLHFSIISQIVSGTIQGCSMVFNNCLRDYVYSKRITDFPMHDFVLITYAIAAGRVIYDENPSFSYRIHENNVVANEGKNVIRHLVHSLNKWFSKDHIFENSSFARQILVDNECYLDQETILYINWITHCKRSVINRLKVVNSPLSTTVNKRAERSFKIRVLLGII